MTGLEKALTDALDEAWMKLDRNHPKLACFALYRAVKLLAGLAIHQEARSLDRKQAQEPPESPAGTNPPCQWENLARKHQDLITEALIYIRINPERCERALREALK